MRSIALEGIDGSGKTTVAQELENQFAAEGLQVMRFAPFKIANEQLGEDIYPLWSSRGGAKVALQTMQQVFKDCEALAQSSKADICIYDRHWMTVMTEIDGDRTLMAELTHFVPAALLRVTPSVALQRMQNDRTALWSRPGRLQRYADSYEKIARANFGTMLGIYRSDPDVSPEALARNIIWDMNIRR